MPQSYYDLRKRYCNTLSLITMDQGPYFKDPHPRKFNVYVICHDEAVHEPYQTDNVKGDSLASQVVKNPPCSGFELGISETKVRHTYHYTIDCLMAVNHFLQLKLSLHQSLIFYWFNLVNDNNNTNIQTLLHM
jgi:hypothetical protein